MICKVRMQSHNTKRFKLLLSNILSCLSVVFDWSFFKFIFSHPPLFIDKLSSSLKTYSFIVLRSGSISFLPIDSPIISFKTLRTRIPIISISPWFKSGSIIPIVFLNKWNVYSSAKLLIFSILQLFLFIFFNEIVKRYLFHV